MKGKRSLKEQEPQVASAQEFIERTATDVERLRELLKCLDKETTASFIIAGREQKLVCSLPSVFYGLPFDFLLLNGQLEPKSDGTKGIFVRWHHVEKNKISPGYLSGANSHHAIYLGFSINHLDELDRGRINIVLRSCLRDPSIIELCKLEVMDYREAIRRYWTRENHPRFNNFALRIQESISVLSRLFAIQEAECYP